MAGFAAYGTLLRREILDRAWLVHSLSSRPVCLAIAWAILSASPQETQRPGGGRLHPAFTALDGYKLSLWNEFYTREFDTLTVCSFLTPAIKLKPVGPNSQVWPIFFLPIGIKAPFQKMPAIFGKYTPVRNLKGGGIESCSGAAAAGLTIANAVVNNRPRRKVLCLAHLCFFVHLWLLIHFTLCLWLLPDPALVLHSFFYWSWDLLNCGVWR